MANLNNSTQQNAVKFRKVGGLAFPTDYNWTCAECGAENRAFKYDCYHCLVDKEQKEWQS